MTFKIGDVVSVSKDNMDCSGKGSRRLSIGNKGIIVGFRHDEVFVQWENWEENNYYSKDHTGNSRSPGWYMTNIYIELVTPISISLQITNKIKEMEQRWEQRNISLSSDKIEIDYEDAVSSTW